MLSEQGKRHAAADGVVYENEGGAEPPEALRAGKDPASRSMSVPSSTKDQTGITTPEGLVVGHVTPRSHFSVVYL